jgi:hypothetical protein
MTYEVGSGAWAPQAKQTQKLTRVYLSQQLWSSRSNARIHRQVFHGLTFGEKLLVNLI